MSRILSLLHLDDRWFHYWQIRLQPSSAEFRRKRRELQTRQLHLMKRVDAMRDVLSSKDAGHGD